MNTFLGSFATLNEHNDEFFSPIGFFFKGKDSEIRYWLNVAVDESKQSFDGPHSTTGHTTATN